MPCARPPDCFATNPVCGVRSRRQLRLEFTLMVYLTRFSLAAHCAAIFAFLLTVSSSAASAPQVVISEIMYHPPGTNQLEQWFELFNAGNKGVDLSGWQVTKGV